MFVLAPSAGLLQYCFCSLRSLLLVVFSRTKRKLRVLFVLGCALLRGDLLFIFVSLIRVSSHAFSFVFSFIIFSGRPVVGDHLIARFESAIFQVWYLF